jgi:hypothetical protein
MTKAIIDMAGPLSTSVSDYIIVRKNGMPARKAEADLGWRHSSIEARRLDRSCSRLLPRPGSGFPKSSTLYSNTSRRIWTPAVLKKCSGTTERVSKKTG